ncbi:YdiH family protein [Dryocola sp. LX212]|jgi:hypothetical protein
MNTKTSPATLAFEFLRREAESLTPAQYLVKFNQLKLEFADLMELTSLELREEISHAHSLGIH